MASTTMICSGKDGVGKSSIAAFLGEALAASNRKVLLIELDEGLSCLDCFVNSSGHGICTLADVLNGRCEPQAAVDHSKHYDNLHVIAAASSRETLPLEQLPTLVMALSDGYDHVIIDTACDDEAIKVVSKIAMNNIAVCTPDPLSLRDAKYVCDRLYDDHAPNIRLVINRVDPTLIKKGLVPHLDYCIDTVGAQLIAAIPSLDDIPLCASTGKKLPRGSLAEKIFGNLAMRLEGKDVPMAVL